VDVGYLADHVKFVCLDSCFVFFIFVDIFLVCVLRILTVGLCIYL